MKAFLAGKFSEDSLKFELNKDTGRTGNFEVVLKETGQLIHSKQAGLGKCESESERDAVVVAIHDFLSNK